MSDTSVQDPPPPVDDAAPEKLAELREAAKRGREATERAEAAERKLAFIEAGIPVDKLAGPLGKMFSASYDGELTVDAVKAAATEIGLIEAEGNNEPTEEEQSETDLRRQVSGDPAGSTQAPGTGTHPRDVALAAYRENINKGMPDEMAQQEYVAQLISIGANGDGRVWFNQGDWDANARLYGNGPR